MTWRYAIFIRPFPEIFFSSLGRVNEISQAGLRRFDPEVTQWQGGLQRGYGLPVRLFSCCGVFVPGNYRCGWVVNEVPQTTSLRMLDKLAGDARIQLHFYSLDRQLLGQHVEILVLSRTP